MLEGDLDRRDFVAALVGGATAAFVTANWTEIRAVGVLAAATPQGAPYRSLTADQVRELDAITATLVPTDDTPGAREAQVVRFMDNALATFWKERQPGLPKFLAEISGLVEKRAPGTKSFAALSVADRVAVLEEMEKTSRQSFNQLRGFTMIGMFAHPDHGGNAGRVGWKLIGFEDRYSWAPPFGYYDRA